MSSESAKTTGAETKVREPAFPLTLDDPIAFAESLIDHVELRKFYKAHGIHCFGCGAAEAESFREGAEVHAGGPYGRFDAQKLIDELNELGKKYPYSNETRIELTLTRTLMGWLFASNSAD